MKSSTLVAIAIIALGLYTRTASAQNDAPPPGGIYTVGSYVGSFLGGDQGYTIAGLDNVGNFVYSSLGKCPTAIFGNNDCYSTINSGYVTAVGTTLPDLNYVRGTPCGGSTPGLFNKDICNGSVEVFSLYGHGEVIPGLSNGVYEGSALDPFHATLIYAGSGEISIGAVNALGDFFFNDDLADNLYIHYTENNVPTPEPSSLALLGTGLLSALVGLRRQV